MGACAVLCSHHFHHRGFWRHVRPHHRGDSLCRLRHDCGNCGEFHHHVRGYYHPDRCGQGPSRAEQEVWPDQGVQRARAAQREGHHGLRESGAACLTCRRDARGSLFDEVLLCHGHFATGPDDRVDERCLRRNAASQRDVGGRRVPWRSAPDTAPANLGRRDASEDLPVPGGGVSERRSAGAHLSGSARHPGLCGISGAQRGPGALHRLRGPFRAAHWQAPSAFGGQPPALFQPVGRQRGNFVGDSEPAGSLPIQALRSPQLLGRVRALCGSASAGILRAGGVGDGRGSAGAAQERPTGA
mmetsp:Transcript_125294/g.297370  ORF Transcript_125294/g.297370 Transcript_125294/m.297370 type:complete len:300 (+) Transcript_125294:1069-1968(+)